MTEISNGCVAPIKQRKCGCPPVPKLEGMKFGMITVLRQDGHYHYPNRKQRAVMWLCRCDCGKEKRMLTHHFRRNPTASCGCFRKKPLFTKPPLCVKKHGMTGTATYRCWQGIIQRCTNSGHSSFHRYGGRGIKVCERWLKFENFYKDMGERPDDLWIERLNNNGDYCPENCAWRTRLEQQNNRGDNHWIEINGERKTATQWASVAGLSRHTMFKRIRLGWGGERLISPVLQSYRRIR